MGLGGDGSLGRQEEGGAEALRRLDAVPRPPLAPELLLLSVLVLGPRIEVSLGPSMFPQLPVRLWPWLGVYRWEDGASAQKRGRL